MRDQYTISELCTALKVSRSGYHAWKTRKPGPRAQANERLLEKMRQIHAHRHMRAYGSPRMRAELNAQGQSCSRGRIARLMRRAKLHARPRRPYRPRTTRADNAAAASPNLLAQQAPPTRPHQQIVSDITYIPTRQGWLYLTIVLDLFSRAILGWDLPNSLAAEGVQRALRRALQRQRIAPGVIFHSDRGCQYTSTLVRRTLAGPKWTQSMSAKGNCYDNAYAESCFASIKDELLPQGGVFDTQLQARRAIFDYIETFYNRRRRHSSLGYRSPHQFLELYFQSQLNHTN